MTKFSGLALTTLASLLLLQGCSSSPTASKSPWVAPQTQAAQTPPGSLDMKNQWNGVTPPPVANPPSAINQAQIVPPPMPMTPAGHKIKVALLVPLSGNNADVGESISNAAQMAVFDSGVENFELVPRDTHGTAAGAAAAAQSAVQDGAQLILGPLFAEEVRSVTPIVSAANINMIAFTTDWKQAGPNTYIMGFVPFGQVQRVISYAATKGIHNIGVIAPDSEYGNAVMNAYSAQASLSGIQTIDIIRTRPADPTLPTAVQKFSRSAARKGTATPPPFDAVFVPLGGSDVQTVGNLLSYNDLDPSKVRRLGTGLWDNAMITHETNLAGGWFAAPDPAARKIFEQKYQTTYGAAPSRLASLGYDATALAAVLARNGGTASFERSAITNPNGFSGIDGIFRFRTDGLAERGLAILELRNGETIVVDPAPRSFQPSP